MRNELKQQIRKITQYTIPITGSNWLNLISGFICMLFIARLGHLDLAAAALAMISFNTLVTIPSMSLYAISILIGHARGKEDKKIIGTITKNGLWIGLALAIPSAIISNFMPNILLLAGQSPQLVELTRTFFHIAAFVIISSTISTVISQFFIGIGKPRITFIARCIRIPFTITTSYILILGKLGLPHLGLTGLALGTLISQSLFLAGLVIYVFYQYGEAYYLTNKSSWFDYSISKRILKIGIPIGVQFGGELLARMGGIYLLGLFGAIPLAAHEIVSQYGFFIIMLTLGISQAVSVLSSEALGKKEYLVPKSIFLAGITVLCIVMCFIGLVFILFPNILILPFLSMSHIDAEKIAHLTRVFFILAVLGLWVDGIRNIICATLRGYHDSKTPMLIGTLCLWVVSLPLSYLVGIHWQGGPIILRLGFITGVIIATLWIWLRLNAKWKNQLNEFVNFGGNHVKQ